MYKCRSNSLKSVIKYVSKKSIKSTSGTQLKFTLYYKNLMLRNLKYNVSIFCLFVCLFTNRAMFHHSNLQWAYVNIHQVENILDKVGLIFGSMIPNKSYLVSSNVLEVRYGICHIQIGYSEI